MESGEEIIITDVIVMECVYVMEGSYNKTRHQIATALTMLFAQEKIIDVAGLSQTYLTFYKESKLDIADCFLIAYSLKNNVPLKTFDKKMMHLYEGYSKK